MRATKNKQVKKKKFKGFFLFLALKFFHINPLALHRPIIIIRYFFHSATSINCRINNSGLTIPVIGLTSAP